MEIDKTVVTFFVLFLSVYFLESIGGFYMTSAIVSIERQFQIPSKISGLMVSAGDFGYIPSVVFVSYLGGKGNRARWIGGGCMLIAIANLLICSSNFLFPVQKNALNTSVLESAVEWDTRRLDANAYTLHYDDLVDFVHQLTPELQQLIQTPPSEDLVNANNKAMELTSNTTQPTALLAAGTTTTTVSTTRAMGSPIHSHSEWLSPLYYCFELNGSSNNNSYGITDSNCRAFFAFLRRYNAATKEEVENLRRLSATPYAYCDRALNGLRGEIQQMRCSNRGGWASVGPTATIFFGLLILGVGRTMPFSLGLPLIDDNVRHKNLPLYLAGMFTIRILGPLTGMMMGAFFNKYYYTSDVPQGITPKDPMWIGRWWGGFLICGLVLFGPSLALFCFRAPDPEAEEESSNSSGEDDMGANKETTITKEALLGEQPNGREKGEQQPGQNNKGKTTTTGGNSGLTKRRGLALVDRHAERGADGKALVPNTFDKKVRDFASSISSVVRQPVYAGTLAGRILDVMAFRGFHIFLPKYLELQFGIPQYKINAYMGVIGIAGFACGLIAGSVCLKLLKLEGRKVALWVTCCGAIAACLSIANGFVGCKSTLTTLGERGIPTNFNMNSSCLLGCSCGSVPLYPVCDDYGTVYYSPCHAGCALNISAYSREQQPAADLQTAPNFSDCRCAQTPSRTVSRERCREGECDRKVIIYFITMALGGVIGGMGVVPGMLILLRSVPPKNRSISLGFNGFLVSLLATLPSPILWGALIDHFCIYWEHKCQGDQTRGHCSLYATDRLRMWLHFIYGGIRLVSMLTGLIEHIASMTVWLLFFDLFVLYHAKDLKITEEAKAAPSTAPETGEDGKQIGAVEAGEGELKSSGEEEDKEAADRVKWRRQHKRETSRDLSHSPVTARHRRKKSDASEETELWRKSSGVQEWMQ